MRSWPRLLLRLAAASFGGNGDEHLVGFVDISALSELLSHGDFGEVDRRAGTPIEGFVEHGTPTMSNWTLSMSGLSAELSGDHERADVLDRLIDTDVG